MNSEQKIGIGIACFLVLSISFAICGMIAENKAKDYACKELGFEEYDFGMGQVYCEDSEYNLHFIKMKCKYLPFDIRCRAIKITVGDVAIKDALVSGDENE